MDVKNTAESFSSSAVNQGSVEYVADQVLAQKQTVYLCSIQPSLCVSQRLQKLIGFVSLEENTGIAVVQRQLQALGVFS